MDVLDVEMQKIAVVAKKEDEDAKARELPPSSSEILCVMLWFMLGFVELLLVIFSSSPVIQRNPDVFRSPQETQELRRAVLCIAVLMVIMAVFYGASSRGSERAMEACRWMARKSTQMCCSMCCRYAAVLAAVIVPLVLVSVYLYPDVT